MGRGADTHAIANQAGPRRHVNAVAALRAGETVELEGCLFEADGDGRPMSKGDWYVAQRSGGPKLLTVKSFSYYSMAERTVTKTTDSLAADDPWPSWILPQEFPAYSFDYGECVKVREVTGD